MRLKITEPAFEQIKKFEGPLFYDLREERLGDMAASLAVMDWIERTLPEGYKITAIIPPDAPLDISAVREVKVLEKLAPLDGLDVHTKDLQIPSLWSLNQRALIEGVHPNLGATGRDLGEIVFVPLAEVEYNKRRNMDLEWIRKTVDALRDAGHFVNIFYDKPHRDLQDAIHLPLKELIPRIAGARLMVGGDSGLCLTGETKVSLLNGTEMRIDEIPAGAGIEVYSCAEDGKIIPSKARSLGVTKHVTELIEVTLDNGESVRCTPEHLWMKRDGSYVAAAALATGDSLMPLYRKTNAKGYEEYLNNATKKWQRTHSEVATVLVEGIAESWERVQMSNIRRLIKAAKRIGVFQPTNHSVVSVERIILPVAVPVYDIETLGYEHNFALTAGVIVHNSHVAAACSVPQIAIYPDWIRFGKHSYTDAQRVAEWWEIPFTVSSFLPNNPHSTFVELGTDHKFSIAKILEVANTVEKRVDN